MDSQRTTRLAPSPTGALHLGNARTFLVNWLMARQRGWRVVLRVEDIDGPRVKRGADAGAIEDLRWLGIDWDEGPVYQSHRLGAYEAALRRLGERGWLVVRRVEVSDGPRGKRGADGGAIEALRWLGIEWDEGPVYQSHRLGAYEAALRRLGERGHTFYCACSRKDIEQAASAP